jgi:hypothetical protein
MIDEAERGVWVSWEELWAEREHSAALVPGRPDNGCSVFFFLLSKLCFFSCEKVI